MTICGRAWHDLCFGTLRSRAKITMFMLLHLPASLAAAFSAVAQMRLLLNSLAMWWPFAWSECVCLPTVLFLLWIPAPRSHCVPVVIASKSKAARRWSLAEKHARAMHVLTQRSWPWLVQASLMMALWIVRLCASRHTASDQLLECQAQRVQTKVSSNRCEMFPGVPS